MEFRLTYEGQLLGASRTDTRAKHKHETRKIFHKQLRRLWEIKPYLKSGLPVSLEEVPFLPATLMLGPNTPPEKIAEFDKAREGMPRPKTWTTMHTTLVEWLGARYVQDGYRFIPLVRRELSLICSIHVLFLRPDQPGDVLRSGDIDNRLKTLFDALRLPKNKDELGGYDAPGVDENPFFCLLEDDSLITDVSVETDLLLAPIRDQFSDNDARLVISVKLRPYDVNPGNVNFG